MLPREAKRFDCFLGQIRPRDPDFLPVKLKLEFRISSVSRITFFFFFFLGGGGGWVEGESGFQSPDRAVKSLITLFTSCKSHSRGQISG